MTQEPDQQTPKGDGRTRQLDELDAKIAKYKLQHQEEPVKKEGVRQGLGKGAAMASDFIAALFAGGLLGYFLDSWLETAPWLMVLGLFLGLGAGVKNMIVAAEAETRRQQEARETEERQAALAAKVRSAKSDDGNQGDAAKE